MRRLAPTAARIAYLLGFAASLGAGRRGSRLLVGLGIAAGAAALGASLAGSLVAADAKLDRSLQAVPAGERSVQVAHFGIARQDSSYGELDRAAHEALEPLRLGPPLRVLQFRATTRLGGDPAILAAVEGLDRWVRLRSGRLPRGCTPQRCEVLRLGGRGRDPAGDGSPLVVVGRASLASPLPFGRLLGDQGGPSLEAPGRQDAPFLLAGDVEGIDGWQLLASIYRTYAWIVPLERVHPWQADGLRAQLDDAQATLHARSFAFEVQAPTEEIEAAADEARVAGRRLLLVGGQVAALVLAFTILAAEALRRDFLTVRRRLTWFGARRWQIAAIAAVDLGAMAVAATLVGWLAATATAAAIAERAGAPAGAVIRHGLISPPGLAAAGAVAVVVTIALLAMVYATRAPRARRISALDVAAAGVLATLLLALSRGAADPEALSHESGSVALVLLLPALALFVAAAVFARLLVPALVALSRPATRIPNVRWRLPLLALARNPGRAGIAAAFLVVSVGGALFALAYRATLERGVEDRLHYAYPLDFVLRENLARDLVRPPEVAPLSLYSALGDGVDVVPGIRRAGEVPTLAGAQKLTMLALPADQLGLLDGWRADFSSSSRAEIARRLAPPQPVALRGARIPRNATALIVKASTRGDAVGLRASVLNGRGDFTTLDLGIAMRGRPLLLRAGLPPRARGGLLVALTLTRALEVEGHAKDNVPIVSGTVTLGPLEAQVGNRRQTVTRYAGWRGAGDVSVSEVGTTRLRYAVTNDIESRFRPRQPLDGAAIPVLASPAVAATASEEGLLPLRLPGGELTARVVATAEHFPTLDGDFVVADEATLFSALNTRRPGSAVTSEIWVGAPEDETARLEQALRSSPFSALTLETRASLEAELEDDPLARGTVLALTASALVALGLGLVGLVLLVRGDVSDERGELFDLEAQGADPRLLRFYVRGRAALVGILGTAAGLASGAALTGLVVSVVTVTAGGTAGVPPLELVLDWPTLALASALFAAVVGSAVALSTWRVFA